MRHILPEVHPIADQFPGMGAEELGQLAENIRAVGLRKPIVLFQGRVWDGRARQAACEMAEVTPRYWILRRADPIIFLLERHARYGSALSPERGAALAKLHQLDEEPWRSSFAKERRDWIAQARREFRALPKQLQPCAICGKHIDFVHAHHCLPLTTQFDLGMVDANHEHDWLCPVHHQIIHVFISIYISGSRPGEILDGVPDEQAEEWLRTGDLFRRRGLALFEEQGGVRSDLGQWQERNA
jgi:hypothetical protein